MLQKKEEEGLFAGFIGFGRTVMGGIESHDEVSTRYKWLLGEITALLGLTHAMVIDKLEEIERAKSLDEARTVLDQVRGEPLSRAFHAEGLCDAFVGLGEALIGVNDRIKFTVESAGQRHPFPREQEATIEAFARMLASREYEVAQQYGRQIRELRDLLWHDHEHGDLRDIQRQASIAKRVLIDQMADFDALANKFKRRSRTQ